MASVRTEIPDVIANRVRARIAALNLVRKPSPKVTLEREYADLIEWASFHHPSYRELPKTPSPPVQ